MVRFNSYYKNIKQNSKPIKMKEYPETHQKGIVSIEQNLLVSNKVGDLGIQIAKDGRIWVCIDGIAAIRFKPLSKETIEFMKKEE